MFKHFASSAYLAGSMFVFAVSVEGFAAPPGWLEPRSIDGSGNNIAHPDWGRAGIMLMRQTTAMYVDGAAAPAGADRPSPRMISNIVCAQAGLIPNTHRATDYLWQWGQFIDHDITLVEIAQPIEPFDISVPMGDPMFDPTHTGGQRIVLNRSAFMASTGTGPGNPRQQMQSLTAFVDGSMVYGSDPVRAAALRAHDGSGRLATSPGNLMPFNTAGLHNAGGPSPDLFLAGDVRANEQAALAVMHTLWVREHNWWADRIRARHRRLSDDQIYELARLIVGAEIQVITYEEFLPVLLGPGALPRYRGYDPAVRPDIDNVFATAAFRVGHTLLSPVIQRRESDGSTSPHGDLPLRDAFFATHVIIDEGGLEPILRGLAAQRAQQVDAFVIDDVRNFLFGPPGAGGFDLAALNIQRGRDHGLPGYNQVRAEMGLAPAVSFSDISSDPLVQQRLADAYGDVNKIDVWVGAISEDHAPGAMVGELIRHLVAEQFRRLRDGDRFWYEHVFRGAMLRQLRDTRLSDVIRRNTNIGRELPDDVFHLPGACEGDTNGDGVVDVRDLLAVISTFGSDDDAADVTGDGVVDVRDLLFVLRRFGPCDAP